MKKSTKTRIDAWDAGLTETQRWQAYDVFCREPWHKVAVFVEKEWGLPQPSRNALYRWAGRMRGQASARRVEQAVAARGEVAALATAVSLDDTLRNAYMSLAADLALGGNAAEAVRFTNMAMDIGAAQAKKRELDLREAGQRTRDATLELAVKKFEAAEAKLRAVAEVVAEAKASGMTPDTLDRIEEAAKLL